MDANPPPVYRPAPKTNWPLILAIVFGVGVVGLASLGLLVYFAFHNFMAQVPAHSEHGRLAVKPLDHGWSSSLIPEVGVQIETPCNLAFFRRSLTKRRYPWLESYTSYHGKSAYGTIVVGALWMKPSDPHFSAAKLAADGEALVKRNSMLKFKNDELSNLTVDGRPALSSVLHYTRGDKDYTQKTLLFENGDNLLYIEADYRDIKSAQAEPDWQRIVSSTKWSRATHLPNG